MADLDKHQHGEPVDPTTLPPDVIVSPDTRRAERVPPGQVRTRKWPVLDAHGTAWIETESWTLDVGGLVENRLHFTWAQFRELPRVKVYSDFHCVTTWSRLGNLWEGVAVREILSRAKPKSSARFALLTGRDEGWTTNLPLADLDVEDALFADTHDGAPLAPEHGGPVRLVVPRLYAWKSAKWVVGLDLLAEDRLGFWEKAGYHEHGDPWTEERHRDL